jgi:LDH2 family malate/lactate/ureidoglycolate dehydrogenase
MKAETGFHIFPAEYLRNFSTTVFMHFGVPRADAEQPADVLARSDLRGIDSPRRRAAARLLRNARAGANQTQAEY